MKDRPERRQRSERRRRNVVERVVHGHHHDAEPKGRADGLEHQPGKHDHRPAERPQDDEDRDPVVDVELQPEAADDEDVEQEEPGAAGEQEAARVPPLGLRRNARNAPVPASRKKTGAQKCVTHRVKNNATVACAGSVGFTPGMAEEVAHVIERHDEHDRAAQDVDGFQARGGGGVGRRPRGPTPW